MVHFQIGDVILLHVHKMQFSRLSGGLFTEDDCWDFLADNMAPLTKGEGTPCPQGSGGEATAQMFLKDFGEALDTFPKNKVSVHNIQLVSLCSHF